eukprot:CAMPEP_0180644746 /NCGR_PEP_ID=MMETSP1037_2-20121125/48577_1 /TAXON_ID=632150 /ORGANISM="Azadinium spinosum, Strain 3D9" /LENGTH=155 /DNA_ID=CAMNT_0022668471 /DNA_START=1 /DNA_END=465 /DNA_ORIENTATION=+
MTAKDPLIPWRTLLVTEPECEAWKATTSKWARMDDEKRKSVRRSQSASALSRTGPAAVRRIRFEGKSTYSTDFGGSSSGPSVGNGSTSPAKTVRLDEARLRVPEQLLVKDGGIFTWHKVGDADREHRRQTRNFGGNQRPHPHITKLCDSAARSRI